GSVVNVDVYARIPELQDKIVWSQPHLAIPEVEDAVVAFENRDRFARTRLEPIKVVLQAIPIRTALDCVPQRKNEMFAAHARRRVVDIGNGLVMIPVPRRLQHAPSRAGRVIVDVHHIVYPARYGCSDYYL